jgi:hypothetical protein
MWSVLASVLLAAFYLRSPVICSRYMLDFSPAFAVPLAGLWCWTIERIALMQRSKWIFASVLVVLMTWQGSEIGLGKSEYGPPLSVTKTELLERTRLRSQPSKPLPNEYRLGNSIEAFGIPYNGSGWDEISGQLSVSAIFFVQDPEFLELELSVAPGENVQEASVACVQAKVGLEFLDRESIVRTNEGWIVRFAGPKERRYQQGVQPAFLAIVSPQELAKFASTPTPWILGRLSWRSVASQPRNSK